MVEHAFSLFAVHRPDFRNVWNVEHPLFRSTIVSYDHTEIFNILNFGYVLFKISWVKTLINVVNTRKAFFFFCHFTFKTLSELQSLREKKVCKQCEIGIYFSVNMGGTE